MPGISKTKFGLACGSIFGFLFFIAWFVLKSMYEGDLNHGSLLERIIVPSEMRKLTNIEELDAIRSFYSADSFEGFYRVVFKLNDNCIHEIIKKTSTELKWNEVSSDFGEWGWSRNFESDGLYIYIMSKGDKYVTIKIMKK